MSNPAILRALFAAFVSAALLACGLVDETPSYRYRMTVEVDTPEGLKSGSSVIEVDTSRGVSTANPAGSVVISKVRGEAAAVDLPGGRTLFALLRSEDNGDWAKNIMFILAPQGIKDGDRFLGTYANMLAMREAKELPATLGHINRALEGMSGRPMLVTFGDVSDPASVQRVDPDDLAASFGEGVSLRRITVQMTDDPVTTGIEERLEWLPRIADAGGGLVPMVRNELGRYEAALGYDGTLVKIGVTDFTTEAYD